MVRFTILIFFLSLMQTMAVDSYAQMTKLSLKAENERLERVLSTIEHESEFFFLYNKDLIDVEQKVSVDAQNETVKAILDGLLKGKDIAYTVYDRQIVLSNYEVISKMVAQQKTISGKVTDESGITIPGVTVLIKGTTKGTVTDTNGKYSIANMPDDATLQFTFVGMQTQEIATGDMATIDVIMLVDIYNINEVITIGYSTVKKRDVSGSISSINSKNLTKSGSPNIAQAIQGQTAGVLITQKSGRPGAGLSVMIRGVGGINDSEPLYVVDGVYGGSLQGINPDEIESIEILKDASSAAIYGARGANGVVLITTKRGSVGSMQVTYNGSVGFQNMINVGNVKMANAQQYGEIQNTMYRNDGQPEPFGGNPGLPGDLFPSPSKLGDGTDWLDVMFRNNAPIQDHLLSFAGGTENHSAYISISYLDQEGLAIESGLTKLNFRVNTDHKIKKWLNVGNSTSFGESEVTGVDYTDHKYGQFYKIILTEPTIPVFNKDGALAGPPNPFYSPSRTPYATTTSNNPVSKSFGLSNYIYADFTPLDYLTFRTSFNNNYSASSNTGYTDNIYSEGIMSGQDISVAGSNPVSMSWTWSNVLKFNKMFEYHSVNALAGYEKIYNTWNSISGNAKYLDPSYRVVSSGASETSSFYQSRGEESMISYFASARYNYKEKYYFTGNVRHDGSSRFGKNNRYGTFPSFSFAWRLSSESFIPEFFSDLKLRVSYGQVGNDKIGNYRYISSMANVFYSFTGQDASFQSGMVTQGLANTGLKWETSTQKDIGIDMAFLDNKLRIVADYFITDISDMLLGKTIPVTTGIGSLSWGRYESIITNVGALTNRGFELEASYTNSVGDFTYNVHANLTSYNNEVTDIGENEYLTGTSGEARNRTYVGGALGDFYGYVSDGIFQTKAELDEANALNPESPYQTNETVPGDFKFKDLDGDGIITDVDRKIIGSPIPDFTYGFGFDLGYKRVNLSALFYGTQGNQVYNSLRSELEQQGRSGNKSTTVLDAWHGEGTSNTIPIRRVQDLNNNFRTSTAYLEDGSFLRLQNIVVSYDLPVPFAKVQVFAAGDNLITFTKYSGFNPQVSMNQAGDFEGGNRLDSGIDAGYYPSTSVFRIGVNVTF